ncbi:MAG TPA: hypothetical protein VH575_27950 [Gemmataceae bacterium]|jgi:hypothetical protein
MSHELFYTSARRGLKPGSQGFCTVAQTRNLPAALAEWLEALSGYRPALPPHDSRTALNPVIQAHYRLLLGGRQAEVLSYVSAAGLDYTQRHNKFAHHVVLEAAELPAGGPAWLLQQPGFMARHWEGEPRLLAAGRNPPQGDMLPAVCRHWDQVTGDAGWAGMLAGAFLDDTSRPAYLLFKLGLDPLPLLAEAIGLLPVERRWEVTFSTYYTGLPQGVRCAWRCVLADSPEAAEADRLPTALVLNLGVPLGRAPDSDLVRQARSGQRSLVRAQRPLVRPTAAAPSRQPTIVPACSVLEVPLVEPTSGPLGGAQLPPPVNRPPRRPRPTSSPSRRLLPAFAFSLLIGLPLTIGAFAVGRFLPQRETLSSPSNDSPSPPTERDRLREGLLPLEVQVTKANGEDKKRNYVVKVADGLKAAGLTNLAELLLQQQDELKGLEQKGEQLRVKIKQTEESLKGSTKALKDLEKKTRSDLEHSRKQLQRARQLSRLRKMLLDHVKKDPRFVTVEQNFRELRDLSVRLDQLVENLQKPKSDLVRVDEDIRQIEEKINALVRATGEPPSAQPTPPATGGDKKTSKEILEKARKKVQDYVDAQEQGQDKEAMDAKKEAESLLDDLEKIKGAEYEKDIKRLRKRLNTNRTKP